MPSSCKDIRAALAQCLQSSDCVFLHRNPPSDCIRPPLKETLPTQCQQLLHGYGQCRRGMVDMRKRFRGNKPIATSVELEGEGPNKMLYAGKGTFEDWDEASKKKMEEGEEWEKFVRNDGIEDVRKK
ncbi:related to PET191, involved in assembly of cytochrome oxidase [Lecanosticta acicola]|uniref:Related to PET191, involved in assembly of cytochrome oxidase n=1 Tax=Lecanosticta acicola TaxID=111012 RepID=A0AAI9EE00_9PEZI|nr:related to PET191, involved in assembly of cytochrome oxidase [Lecanosticta acicola]